MPFSDIRLNDGHLIPAIAYGTGTVNKYKDIHVYIEQAIETGFSHLSTAQMYENEDSVGKAIKDTGLERSELYVTTKYSKSDMSLQDSINASLEMLWKEMAFLKKQGLTKSIGVSNFMVKDLEAAIEYTKVVPAVNQIQLHLNLLAYHASHGIVTEAYGSLAPITKFPGGPVDKPLEEAAKRLGVTTTQVIFLWLRSKGIVIVTTSSNKQHMEEYYAVGDLPPLTTEEIQALEDAGAKVPPQTRPFLRFFLLLGLSALFGYALHLATRSREEFYEFLAFFAVAYALRGAWLWGMARYAQGRESHTVDSISL
ncbi:2,5-diketo-D-gluconic acid reductase [Coprinopsis sp. MPI-PUGE-AT-0042]|nr:2,5-diketo-D-gluconic acid reductase [Coprinopsis sp. MPI-PUGE-AT-0042]